MYSTWFLVNGRLNFRRNRSKHHHHSLLQCRSQNSWIGNASTYSCKKVSDEQNKVVKEFFSRSRILFDHNTYPLSNYFSTVLSKFHDRSSQNRGPTRSLRGCAKCSLIKWKMIPSKDITGCKGSDPRRSNGLDDQEIGNTYFQRKISFGYLQNRRRAKFQSSSSLLQQSVC